MKKVKLWRLVSQDRRDAITDALERQAGKAEGPEKMALLSAIERLTVRPKTTQRRQPGSYLRSSLCKRLEVQETREAAIAEIEAAVRETGGVNKAFAKLGIARRTVYYTLGRNPDVKARIDRVAEELRSATAQEAQANVVGHEPAASELTP